MPGASSDRVIVVGGGIVGSCAAIHCATNGFQVFLFDDPQSTPGATRHAAGILSPPAFYTSSDTRTLSPKKRKLISFARLNRLAFDYYPEFISWLESETGIDVGFERSGALYVAATPEALTRKEVYYTQMLKHGRDVTWFDQSALRKEFPLLGPKIIGGYFYHEESRVDPNRLMNALQTLLDSRVSVHYDEPVTGFETESGRVRGVKTRSGFIPCDYLVLAAGAYSSRLCKTVEFLPVEPRKGEYCIVETDLINGYPPVRLGKRFVLPLSGDRVYLGSTLRETGYDDSVENESMQDLREAGNLVVPGLLTGSGVKWGAGLRPYTPLRGGPVLGPVTEFENLFVATGHYRSGILQGPLTGKVCAEWISGHVETVDLALYSLQR